MIVRTLTIVMLAGGWIAAANAQPDPLPQEVAPDATIELAVGQAKTLRFNSAVTTVNLATEGVAKATPQTERIITIAGVAAGQTMLLVWGRAGERIYSAEIIVSPDFGRSVKIYGQDRSADGLSRLEDYVGYHCTEFTCSRADKDKIGRPSGMSTTITRPGPGGSAISTTSP